MRPQRATYLLGRVCVNQPERLPIPASYASHPYCAIYLSAAAALTGWVDDLSPDDVAGLLDATNHGLSLIDMEVFSLEQWEQECRQITAEDIKPADMRVPHGF